MPLTEEHKQQIRDFVEKMLNDENGEIEVLRGTEDTSDPSDMWRKLDPAPQRYLILRIGPPNIQIDNIIRGALGFDPINFRR